MMTPLFSRLLLPAVALFSLTSCDEFLMEGAGPGYSSYGGGGRGYSRSYSGRSYYGGPQRGYYRNGGGGSRSRNPGYHPNDPDDRNNPSHPDYIGPPGSRASRHAPRYYSNDPDDRNNPSHPDYIGPAGSRPRYRPAPSYHPDDPDDRNNPNHPDYIGPPR